MIVTVSTACWLGAGSDTDAVQVACTVDGAAEVPTVLVVAANVVPAVVDDGPVDVVGVDDRVVGDVTSGLGVLLPPQAANSAANTTKRANRRQRTNDLTMMASN